MATSGQERACGSVRAAITCVMLLTVLALTTALAAQDSASVMRDRAEFSAWLVGAPTSPYAAIYHQALPANGLVLGEEAEPALTALPRGQLSERRGALYLRTVDGERPVPRGRAVQHGRYRIRVDGEPGRSTVTVFDRPNHAEPPVYFAYAASAAVEGTLEPPAAPRTQRLLTLDGVDLEASSAGTITVHRGAQAARLTVYRISDPASEESELTIYFRDATSGVTTYSAGRFLTLFPLGGGRYRVDFNRARNPFCAYSSAYPCPVPWPGNTLPWAVEAGEQYVAHTGAAPEPGP